MRFFRKLRVLILRLQGISVSACCKCHREIFCEIGEDDDFCRLCMPNGKNNDYHEFMTKKLAKRFMKNNWTK